MGAGVVGQRADDLGPQRRGDVVPHALDHQQLGVGDDLGGATTPARVDQAVLVAVDHQGGDRERPQGLGAALELARENITVNGVEPGYIRTAAMELLANADGLAQMTRYIPAGYMGSPEDIAYAMLYLASDEARYITGQTICVDGGSTLPESPVFLDELEGVKELAGSA